MEVYSDPKEVYQVLYSLGFEKKEAVLFLKSLEIKHPASIGFLAKIAGIKRTTAYNIAYNLKGKGFLNSSIIDGIIHFQAVSIEEIKGIFNQQEKDLQLKRTILQKNSHLFEAINVNNEYFNQIEIFTGRNGIEKMYKSFCYSKPHDVFSSAFPYESVFPSKTLYGAFSLDNLKRCHTRLLLTCTRGLKRCAEIHKMAPKTKVKSIKHKEIITNNMIFDDCIAIANFDIENIYGIKISNKLLLGSYKMLFEQLWQSSKLV